MDSNSRFHFIANQRALDFSNTRLLENGAPLDFLATYEDLIDWLTAAGILAPDEAPAIRKRFRRNAAALLKQAHRLRALITTVVEHLMRKEPLPDSALHHVNALLLDSRSHPQLHRTSSGIKIAQQIQFTRPQSLLSPIAESLADLIAYGDPALIRKCENPDCILHIYDTTKNHTRRWCSMAHCGNRAKVTAFRRRHARPERLSPG